MIHKRKRAPGRPAKVDPIERQIIGARLAPDLYKKLVAAAAANRRSISAEIEHRLQRSFEPSPTIPEQRLFDLPMADLERIERLEQIVATLAKALLRKDNEQDGNFCVDSQFTG